MARSLTDAEWRAPVPEPDPDELSIRELCERYCHGDLHYCDQLADDYVLPHLGRAA